MSAVARVEAQWLERGERQPRLTLVAKNDPQQANATLDEDYATGVINDHLAAMAKDEQ